MAPASHFFLASRAGWRAAVLAPTLHVDAQGRLALQPLPGAGRRLAEASGAFGGLALPTGAAIDAAGHLYLLDAAAPAVLLFDPCTCAFAPLPCLGGRGAGPRQLDDPHGLAVTPRGDLLIADRGNRRVQVFARKGLALRRIQGPYRVVRQDGAVRLQPAAPLPGEVPEGGCLPGPSRFPEGTWSPFDVAVAPGCTVYVSDPDNGLIHRFDAAGRFRGALSSEQDGVPLDRPTHLAVDAEGRLFAALEDRPYVVVFAPGGTFVERLERRDQAAARFRPLALAVDRDGNLYVTCTDGCCERIDLYRPDGCGGHAPAGRPLPAGGRIVGFDATGRPLALAGTLLLALEPAVELESEGSYRSQALDSRIYRCPWHRVVIRGRVAPGTRICIETFTAEAEKSDEEIELLAAERWQPGAVHGDTDLTEWDCLVQSPPGRYLWLRLTLAGDGAATPEIDHVRVEYPRSSSLQRLPAIYQEDAESRAFLDRWLSIFDALRSETGEAIGGGAALFDPAATPAGEDGGPDFLTWLAGWMGLVLDRRLPLDRRRRLLAQAHRLYRLRGTLAGLALHLELYTGVAPRILEHFRLRRWLWVGSARLGDCAELFGPDLVDRLQLGVHSRVGGFQLLDSGDPVSDPFAELAHRFTVYVQLPACRDASTVEQLARIVELAKPAHTEGRITVVEPRLRIGIQARVGLDTAVGRYPQGVHAGAGSLGHDTVLGPSAAAAAPPTLTVGVRSRIGASTLID